MHVCCLDYFCYGHVGHICTFVYAIVCVVWYLNVYLFKYVRYAMLDITFEISGGIIKEKF